jgi:uncharacterized membrane protein
MGAVIGIVDPLMVNPVSAFWFLIFIVVLQQLDGNVFGPRILGDSLGISSFWVIMAIILGGGLFGVTGMIVVHPGVRGALRDDERAGARQAEKARHAAGHRVLRRARPARGGLPRAGSAKNHSEKEKKKP